MDSDSQDIGSGSTQSDEDEYGRVGDRSKKRVRKKLKKVGKERSLVSGRNSAENVLIKLRNRQVSERFSE